MTTNDIRDLALGVGSTGGGVAVSLIDQISPYIRFASLCVGFVIGCIILYKHVRHWNDKP